MNKGYDAKFRINGKIKYQDFDTVIDDIRQMKALQYQV